MTGIISTCAGVFGALVGSFLNVCIARMPHNESVVMPASHCRSCKKRIAWHDNIPFVSYLLLRGRCRHCGARISPRYLLVEFLTAVLFAALVWRFGVSVHAVAYGILGAGLIAASFIDFEHQIIPDEISIGGTVAGVLLAAVFPGLLGDESRVLAVGHSLLGALAGGGSIYLIGAVGSFVFRKEAMGGGDVKLMAAIGAFLGWKMVLLTFFIAPFFGSVVGVAMKIKYKAEIIPYGPYLSLAALVSIFFGERLLRVLFSGIFMS